MVCGRRAMVLGAALACLLSSPEPRSGAQEPPAVEIFPLDQVRPGQQLTGRTVLRGAELTPFQGEVLGVIRGVNPGRDMVLCRFSGANLEYTGIIAGMSGSPVYIEGKLLGAVAFTWPFNKEPIGGVTPIGQMQSFAEAPENKIVRFETQPDGSVPVALLDISRDPFAPLQDAVPVAAQSGGDSLRRISLPLAASGFSEHAIARLRERLEPMGLIPVATGAAGVADAAGQSPKIEPGAVLAASLVTGDFDLSGLGTVTHVDGDRVWGWGHPFFSQGQCQYVLRSGWVHLVNPRLDISAKFGSPLEELGVIEADVSTCLAGRLGVKPDLVPMHVSFQSEGGGPKHEFNVRIVRHPTLLAPLVASVLTSALEGVGGLSPEITLSVQAKIAANGLEPITIDNTFSGSGIVGSAGAESLFNQVAVIADGLTRNPFGSARLDSIECQTVISNRRTSAAIMAVRLESDVLEPGDTLRATATLRPYKGEPVDVDIELTLPPETPKGQYTAALCDSTMHLKMLFAEEPQLLTARSVPEVAQSFRRQLEEKRQTLYLRVLVPDTGLIVNEVSLPQLPASARAALVNRKATPPRPIRRALVSRKSCPWVIEGSSMLRFQVVDDKRTASLGKG